MSAAGGRQVHVERERALRRGRWRTTARRWRGPACAAPAHRADGAASRPGRRRCPSRLPTVSGTCTAPCFDVLRTGCDHPIGEHIEREAAGSARGDRDIHGVAGFIVGLVERDLQEVGRVGARLRVEAGVESERGERAVRLGRRHFQPITAPFHRQRNPRRLVGGGIERAVGDALGALDRLEFPLPFWRYHW